VKNVGWFDERLERLGAEEVLALVLLDEDATTVAALAVELDG
jgi:hypothetical protein